MSASTGLGVIMQTKRRSCAWMQLTHVPPGHSIRLTGGVHLSGSTDSALGHIGIFNQCFPAESAGLGYFFEPFCQA